MKTSDSRTSASPSTRLPPSIVIQHPEDDIPPTIKPWTAIINSKGMPNEPTIPPRHSPHQYQAVLDLIWPQIKTMAWRGHNDFADKYMMIRKTGLPNYLSARQQLFSNLNYDAWDSLLTEYHDKEIYEFLRYGWLANYTAHQPPTPTENNHASATAYMSEVDKFIQKECALGGMLGPFQTRPFIPWTQISPLMSRPKKDNDTSRRIIIDLSYPEQRSVNAGIPKNFYQGKESEYTLPSIDDLINQVKIHGKGAYIWKADLAHAYRQLRLDPLDVPLFSLKHRGQYCPSFGARRSGSACQRTTSAAVWLMDRAGHTSLVYIDDFCSVHRDRSQARAAYQFLRQTTLGLH